MLRKLSIAAFVGAFSIAAVPALTSAALAQGTGTEPPSAPAPSEAGMAKSGSMSKGAMMKKGGSMKKGGAMMKKKKKM